MGTNPTLPPVAPASTADFTVNVDEALQHEIDPAAYGKTYGKGLRDSGYLEHQALAIFRAFVKGIAAHMSFIVDAYDSLIAIGVAAITGIATRDNPGFWALIGELISDILGVNVDGDKIFADLKARGTLPAMRDVGGALIGLLVGEFTGTATGKGGEVTFSSNVNPQTGLPEATLTPKSGLDATKALMGFVLTSAVREANIDGIASVIPHGFGEPFLKYTEAMRTNLGIGRLMRFALRPIFQDLVAKPLTWAINLQYRPALLDPADLLLQFLLTDMKPDQLDYEFGRHGYTADQQRALIARHTEKLTIDQARLLWIHGDIDDDTLQDVARRRGWRPGDFALWQRYEDLHPARRLALAVVEEAAIQYLRGHIPQTQLQAAIDASAKDRFGHRLLSEGEQTSLSNFTVTSQKIVRRHLSVAQLMLGYIDGVITLGEVETALSELGFDDNAVRELTQEMLVKQKAAADKAARTHAKAPTPPATPTTPAP